jgi:hypothetical protein
MKKSKKVTKQKNCQQTICGFTCISTLKTCRAKSLRIATSIREKATRLIKTIQNFIKNKTRKYHSYDETYKLGVARVNSAGLDEAIKSYSEREISLSKHIDKEVSRLNVKFLIAGEIPLVIGLHDKEIDQLRKPFDKLDAAIVRKKQAKFSHLFDKAARLEQDIEDALLETSYGRAFDNFRKSIIAQNKTADISGIKIESKFEHLKPAIQEFYNFVGYSPKLNSIKLEHSDETRASISTPKWWYKGGLATLSLDKDYAKPVDIWHELGHSVEDKYPHIRDQNLRWIKSRATNNQLGHLGKGYDFDELGYQGRFFKPYFGKVYPDKSTEVTSLSLEMMSSTASTIEFYRNDPELFSLVVGQITSHTT